MQEANGGADLQRSRSKSINCDQLRVIVAAPRRVIPAVIYLDCRRRSRAIFEVQSPLTGTTCLRRELYLSRLKAFLVQKHKGPKKRSIAYEEDNCGGSKGPTRIGGGHRRAYQLHVSTTQAAYNRCMQLAFWPGIPSHRGPAYNSRYTLIEIVQLRATSNTRCVFLS